MANHKPKGVERMREIGRRGGLVSGSRRLDSMDVMRRRLIAVNAARARWGRPKWSQAEESAFLQGWVSGMEALAGWPHQYRKRAKKPLGKSLAEFPNL